jgi:large subunit ribosomal protein L10
VNRTEKADAVASMGERLGKAPYAFLIDYKGLKVPDATELRRQVRATGSEYLVVKNTLALRALRETPLGALSSHFTGMTAVALSKGDVVGLAKVLHTFGKTNPNVKVKAILVGGKEAPAASLEALASMPTRNELVARLLGLIQSPVRRLVTVLSGPKRKLVVGLKAVADKKAGETAEAA